MIGAALRVSKYFEGDPFEAMHKCTHRVDAAPLIIHLPAIEIQYFYAL